MDNLVAFERILIYYQRWATGDPNPVAKEAEKRRLEEVGKQAIANKIDPRMVTAMRAIRALEDEEEVPVAPEEEERDAKRRRIEAPEEEPEEPEEIAEPPKASTGLLSADTIEGMKYFAQIRQRQQKVPPPKPVTGLGSLGDYGSDED